MIGESVGSYEIVSKLGEGGMGTVYIAKHKLMGSRAAVKLLLPELSCHKAVVDRFFNEARAATMIKHSGIITVFDFGYTPNGNAYIVMELLEGESLTNRILRAGNLDEATAIRLGRQVARALDAAHVAGIVHRDLKPDNIFVIPDDDYPGGERIKVLDFGIAKLSVSDGSAGQTRAGVTMGSPLYMSPEQCQGQVDIDARADIYSFGCVMFHMMNGKPPFGDAASTNIVAILAQHISTPPPDLRALDGRISTGMSEIVSRMLQKQREHRYKSMAEITSAFDRLSAGKFVTRPISAPVVADSADTGTMQAVPPGKASITGTGSSTVLGMSPAKKGATGSQPAVGSRPGIAPTVIASNQANVTRPPQEMVSPVSKSSVTTLGESSGQVTGAGVSGSPEWSPPSTGKGKWIAIAGAAVVALGVGGYFAFGRGGGEAVATNEPAPEPAGQATVSAGAGEHAGAAAGTASEPAEQPAQPDNEAQPDKEPAQPDKAPAQPDKAPAQPDKISVELKSEPSGAQVFRASDGSLLGSTPFWYDIDRSPGELPVIVRHDGFAEARVTLSAADGGKQMVTLNKAAEPPIQKTSPGNKKDKSDRSGSRKKRGWGELM